MLLLLLALLYFHLVLIHLLVLREVCDIEFLVETMEFELHSWANFVQFDCLFGLVS